MSLYSNGTGFGGLYSTRVTVPALLDVNLAHWMIVPAGYVRIRALQKGRTRGELEVNNQVFTAPQIQPHQVIKDGVPNEAHRNIASEIHDNMHCSAVN